MRRLTTTLYAMLLTACAGDFTPVVADAETMNSPMHDDDGGSDSEPGSTSGNSNDDDGPAPSDGSDSASDSDGPEDTEVEPGCGNDIHEPELGEECDGEDIDTTCEELLGEGSGTLGCWDDCTYDVSACSLGGPMPEEGMWSSCDTYIDCLPPDHVDDGTWECFGAGGPYAYCTTICETAAECGPSPGGTAIVVCPDNIKHCVLNCEDGKTCPEGMACAGGIYCQPLAQE